MAAKQDGELTVCDIMGEWGAYQWSLTLFGLIYSSIISVTVVVGPIWTPEMEHVCASSVHMINQASVDWASAAGGHQYHLKQQCFPQQQQQQPANSLAQFGSLRPNASDAEQAWRQQEQEECTSFIYNDANYGRMLTNSVSIKRVPGERPGDKLAATHN